MSAIVLKRFKLEKFVFDQNIDESFISICVNFIVNHNSRMLYSTQIYFFLVQSSLMDCLFDLFKASFKLIALFYRTPNYAIVALN